MMTALYLILFLREIEKDASLSVVLCYSQPCFLALGILGDVIKTKGSWKPPIYYMKELVQVGESFDLLHYVGMWYIRKRVLIGDF